jgi:hypothetical protein
MFLNAPFDLQIFVVILESLFLSLLAIHAFQLDNLEPSMMVNQNQGFYLQEQCMIGNEAWEVRVVFNI